MNEHPLQSLIMLAIEQQDMARPRSRQREVGPSDLGDPCDHCLAAKLAGWEKRPEMAWLAYVGTAFHTQAALAFTDTEIWASEQHLAIGTVAGTWIKGTADLIHWPTRTVIDFKLIGKTKLDAARRGNISPQYRGQVHLYGKGCGAKHVAIAFMPRNELTMDKMVYWTEPYDVNVADGLLRRAESLVRVDPRRQARAPGCYDCPRYDDWDEYKGALYPAVRPIMSMTEIGE